MTMTLEQYENVCHIVTAAEIAIGDITRFRIYSEFGLTKEDIIELGAVEDEEGGIWITPKSILLTEMLDIGKGSSSSTIANIRNERGAFKKFFDSKYFQEKFTNEYQTIYADMMVDVDGIEMSLGFAEVKK